MNILFIIVVIILWYYSIMNDKEKEIDNIISKYNKEYIKIDNQTSINNVYELFVNNVIFEPTCDIEMYYLGHYYNLIKHDYEMCKKYYLMSVDNGNHNAMNNLGYYYHHIELNYDLAIKYYLMAINMNNYYSFNNLGELYETMKKYDLMEKYYLMATERGDSNGTCNLCRYYKNIETNRKKINQYYFCQLSSNVQVAYISISKYVNLDRLELYLNYQNIYGRYVIINCFNTLHIQNITTSQQNRFLQLLKNFDFVEYDVLSISLTILLKNIK